MRRTKFGSRLALEPVSRPMQRSLVQALVVGSLLALALGAFHWFAPEEALGDRESVQRVHTESVSTPNVEDHGAINMREANVAPQRSDIDIDEPPTNIGSAGAGPREGRWAVATMTPEERASFEYHRDKVSEYLPYFEGSKEFEEEFRYGRRARVMATYSAMMIMLAEGEAIPSDAFNALTPEERGAMTRNSLFTMSNAGFEFVMTRGKFPVLDKIFDLNEQHPELVPVGEIPYSDLIAFARRAQSYKLPR